MSQETSSHRINFGQTPLTSPSNSRHLPIKRNLGYLSVYCYLKLKAFYCRHSSDSAASLRVEKQKKSTELNSNVIGSIISCAFQTAQLSGWIKLTIFEHIIIFYLSPTIPLLCCRTVEICRATQLPPSHARSHNVVMWRLINEKRVFQNFTEPRRLLGE